MKQKTARLIPEDLFIKTFPLARLLTIIVFLKNVHNQKKQNKIIVFKNFYCRFENSSGSVSSLKQSYRYSPFNYGFIQRRLGFLAHVHLRCRLFLSFFSGIRWIVGKCRRNDERQC